MSNEIEKFNFDGSAEVRVTTINGEPWFVAADVAKVLGHTNPTVLGDILEDRNRRTLRRSDTLNFPRGINKRVQQIGVVDEPGLYRMIMRSNVPGAQRFQSWVTDEVLPTIRKTGGAYVAPGSSAAEQFAANPLDALESALKIARELESKNKALVERIEDDAPKVLVAEEFFETDGLTGVRETARAFSVPQNTFAGMVRDWGWMDQYGTAAKAYSVSQGYMENKVIVLNGGSRQSVQGKFTRKGISAVARKLRYSTSVQ